MQTSTATSDAAKNCSYMLPVLTQTVPQDSPESSSPGTSSSSSSSSLCSPALPAPHSPHPISGDLPSTIIPSIVSPSLGFDLPAHENMTSSGLPHSPNSPHSSAKSTSSKLSPPPCVSFSSSLASPPAYLHQLSDARGFLDFSSLSTFHTRLASTDDDSSDAPPICRWEGCGQQYSSLQLLVAHLEHDHTLNLQSYVCLWEGCSRQLRPFDARYKLVTHLRCHTGERPYKCNFPECQRKFSRLENLKLHIRTHTGEKPYECHHDGCKKRFNNTSDRAKHMKTHITRKPYVCKYLGCGKAYTDPSSMRKHIKFVHKMKAVSHGAAADVHESRGGDCILSEEVRLPRLVVDTPMSPVQQIVGPSVFIQHPALSSPSSSNVTAPVLIKNEPKASSPHTIIKLSPVSACSSSLTDMSKSPRTTSHFVYSQENFSPSYSSVQAPSQPLYYVMPVVSQGENVRGGSHVTDFVTDRETNRGVVSAAREQMAPWQRRGEHEGDANEVASTEQQIKDKIAHLQHQLLLHQSGKNHHQQQQPLPWIPQSSVSSPTSAVMSSVQASPTLVMSQPPQMLLIQPSGDAPNARAQSNVTIVPTPISPPRNNLVTVVPRGHLLQPTMQQQPVHHHPASQQTAVNQPLVQQSSLIQQMPQQRVVLPNPQVQVIQGGGEGRASGAVPTSPSFMYQQVMLAGQTQPILVPVVPVSQVTPTNS